MNIYPMVSGYRSVPLLVSSRAIENLGLLLASFVLLLLGAEVFTNGVEWLGHRLGISESATGSILAAVGTALPETMIPVIAIIHGVVTGESSSANHVGVGAILGAPFMLATIALFLVGASVRYFSGRRLHGSEFHCNATATRRDLSFFLAGYSLALLAALIPARLSVGPIPTSYIIAVVLLGLYFVYVRRSLARGDLIADEGLESLYLGAILEKYQERLPGVSSSTNHRDDPHRWLVYLQTVLALLLIIAGAQLFVAEIQYFAVSVLHVPTAILALLLAPLATELPEKLNSIIWISRDKDTLAIGNITGAMAFQSTIPVSLGILFTSWDLTLTWGTAGFLNAFSTMLALVSGGILYTRVRSLEDGYLRPKPFFIGGLLYLVFVVIVFYHIFYLNISI